VAWRVRCDANLGRSTSSTDRLAPANIERGAGSVAFGKFNQRGFFVGTALGARHMCRTRETVGDAEPSSASGNRFGWEKITNSDALRRATEKGSISQSLSCALAAARSIRILF